MNQNEIQRPKTLEEKMQKLNERSKIGALDRNKDMFEKEMKHIKEM